MYNNNTEYLTVTGWGYEDLSNTAIAAGATGGGSAVPEPATAFPAGLSRRK